MSVLHLLGSAADGGAETYFLSLTRALHEAAGGQACAIRAHAGRGAALAEAGLPVRVLPFGGPLDLITRHKAAAFARETEARVLVAWMNRAARHAPRGPWRRIGRLGGYYSLKYYRGFDLLVANTRDIARWIVSRGWPEARTRYIPNFAEPGPVPAVPRAAHDTPEGVPLLLGVGRLHAAKAHDVTLKALAAIPGAYLWIAGSGPLEAQLKDLARSLGVLERVRFLGWVGDPSGLYRAADACLFPSRFEPLGNVVIQAWAHGLPVAAAASQGPAALIRPESDGLLIPVDDPEALAEAGRRLLNEKGLADRLRAGGRGRVEDEFSRGRVVGAWRDLIEETA